MTTTIPGDLLALADWSPADIRAALDTAHLLKRGYAPFDRTLAGRAMILLFEKPSLRTRCSFEVGMHRLGGSTTFLDHQGSRIGAREPIVDYAKNIERWADVIVVRAFEHAVVRELAEHASVPVVNALCDVEHPCQALADMLTLEEHLGALSSRSLAYVGDGNNVCHSLMLAAASLGLSMTVITPKDFAPSARIVAETGRRAAASGASLALSHDPADVRGHDAVYTDTWVSMGDEAEHDARVAAFAGFSVTPELMERAGPKAIFMHCLPAHRGEEVQATVIDGPRSVIYDQAENRMHAQCGALLRLLVPALALPIAPRASVAIEVAPGVRATAG